MPSGGMMVAAGISWVLKPAACRRSGFRNGGSGCALLATLRSGSLMENDE
jgi:hypothetical protein